MTVIDCAAGKGLDTLRIRFGGVYPSSMARKPRLFASGVLYHVIVRGNRRQKAFLKHSDFEVYVEKLAQYRVSRYEQKM